MKNRKHLSCQHCERKFTNVSLGLVRANLANHMRKIHPEHYVPKGTPAANGNGAAIEKKPRKSKAGPEVNYCPCCGVNLHAVRVAITL